MIPAGNLLDASGRPSEAEIWLLAENRFAAVARHYRPHQHALKRSMIAEVVRMEADGQAARFGKSPEEIAVLDAEDELYLAQHASVRTMNDEISRARAKLAVAEVALAASRVPFLQAAE